MADEVVDSDVGGELQRGCARKTGLLESGRRSHQGPTMKPDMLLSPLFERA
jgi:hypothetical protein